MTKKTSDSSIGTKTKKTSTKKEPESKTVASKTKKGKEGQKQDIPSVDKAEKAKQAAVKAEKEMKNKLRESEEKIKEWQDKYIRLSAEFDNYRKRTLKEKSDLIKSANEDLLRDILSVVDDFERGINTIDKSEDLNALRQGIHLIYDKFNVFLKQKGVKEIEAREKDFDLDLHEAMTKIPAPSDDLKGKVVDVIEKGYLLNDKVIRYAKVVVGE